MSQSESISTLIAALVECQKNGFGITRSRNVEVTMKKKPDGSGGGKYNFKYATFDHIISQMRGSLTDNGLWFTQFVTDGRMVTRILHSSGEWLDTGVPMPNINGSPQDIGSVISYFKRYSFSAAFGIVSEEDGDDIEGEREVDFRSNQRGSGAPPPQDAGLEIPPQGWGDFARGLMKTFSDKESIEELDAIKEANKRYINGLAKAERAMFADVQKAYENRKAVLGDAIPF